jgi:hypothetical protein
MKVYQELNLKLKKVSDIEFIEIIKIFTQQVKDWTYLEKESKERIEETGNPSCMIFLDDDYHKPTFLITKRKDEFYSISNIFNSQHGDIPIPEYNALLKHFYKDFRKIIDFNSYNIVIKISEEDIGLKEIIPSQTARDLFERYLSFQPRSYHVNDKERLDLFIGAASRSKKKINAEWIEQYLTEELNWSQEDARWCRNRIEVGLEILKVNRNYHK